MNGTGDWKSKTSLIWNQTGGGNIFFNKIYFGEVLLHHFKLKYR